jgi:hypothetical protein
LGKVRVIQNLEIVPGQTLSISTTDIITEEKRGRTWELEHKIK